MPELPEVQTVVNSLVKPLSGRKITNIRAHWPKVLRRRGVWPTTAVRAVWQQLPRRAAQPVRVVLATDAQAAPAKRLLELGAGAARVVGDTADNYNGGARPRYEAHDHGLVDWHVESGEHE